MKQTKKYKGIIAIFNDLFQNCQVICTVWIWPLCVCGFFLNQRRGSFMFFVLNINVSIKEDMRINYLDISVAVSLFFIFFCGVHTCIANTFVNRSENKCRATFLQILIQNLGTFTNFSPHLPWPKVSSIFCINYIIIQRRLLCYICIFGWASAFNFVFSWVKIETVQFFLDVSLVYTMSGHKKSTILHERS